MTAKATGRRVQRTFLDPDSADLRGFARSIVMISALQLLLAIAYLFFGDVAADQREPYIALLLGFAALVVMFRLPGVMRRQVRLRLALEALAMVLFTTALTLFSGGIDSPLVNLYLLPLLVGCIVLGRSATIGLLLLVFVSFAGVGVWSDDLTTPTATQIISILLQFAPMLLATYLTILLAENIRSTRRQILDMSERDDLTELYNMRAFSARLEATHLAAIRHNQPYGILMIDVDNLKPINDEYGHEAGNRAIQLVGKSIARCIRSSDVAARYGGDEFIVLLPHSTPDASTQAGNRIRNSIFATTLKVERKMVRVSVSTGLATFPDDGSDPGALLAAADKAMYLDKANRRQRDRTPAAVAGDN